MTSCFQRRLFAPAMFCAWLVAPQAETTLASSLPFTVLHHFSSSSAEGHSPQSGVTFSGSKLVGVTVSGGSDNLGTAYAINLDGSGYTLLHSFTGKPDGKQPWGTVAASNSTMYGTTTGGGTADRGSIFSVGVGGAGYTVLHSFPTTGAEGNYPYAGLVFDGVKLYGAAQAGGAAGMGTLYSIRPDGTDFTVIHTFTGPDGEFPAIDLTLVGSMLYGTAQFDSLGSKGNIFKLNTDGTGFSTLHRFNGADGREPDGKLTVVGNQVFGTTFEEGPSGGGTVFKVNTNGTGFATLHSFSQTDSYAPDGGLTLVGSQLFGTTSVGPPHVKGTVYSMDLTGANFATVHTFTGGDGANPNGTLLLVDSTLYGTTSLGGTHGQGVVFAIEVPEPTSLSLATVPLGMLLLGAMRRHGRRSRRVA